MSDAARWQIGDATVTSLVEAQIPGIPPELFFPEATADDVRRCSWLDDSIASADGTIAFRVQAFLVQTPTITALVDPCVGNGKQRRLPFWHQLDLPWLDTLATTGVSPDDIELVIHTHLHADHVGWDTHPVDGAWRPTFEQARHVYVGEELEHWRREEQRVEEDVFGDSIEPIIDAGLADLVDDTADLGHGLRLFPTLGHTPGHVSLAITSDGERIVITGDLIHHQVQMAHPRWTEVGDTDPATAVDTRQAFLDEHCAAGTLIAGTHFPSNPVGHVVRDSGAWRFEPTPHA